MTISIIVLLAPSMSAFTPLPHMARTSPALSAILPSQTPSLARKEVLRSSLTCQEVQLRSVCGRRGGTTRASATAVAAAVTGPYAIPVTFGIAAAAGLLAYIRQAYIFSLSYGLAMAFIGGAVLVAAPASTVLKVHAGLVTLYGARLFAFLLWRAHLAPNSPVPPPSGVLMLRPEPRSPQAKSFSRATTARRG